MEKVEVGQRGARPHAGAVEALFTAEYPELCRLARAHLRRSGRGAGLDTTTVVHECYLRFAQASEVSFEDRMHFLAYLSRAMRTVIVDFARRRVAARRGGGLPHEPFTEGEAALAAHPVDVLPVREALDELAALDERMARVVRLRYFAGMTEADTAATLGVTERTVRRTWEKARLLLAEALRDG